MLEQTFRNIDNALREEAGCLLGGIERSYTAWNNDQRVVTILERFKRRDKKLHNVHPVRLMDFLVWKVGRERLLSTAGRARVLTEDPDAVAPARMGVAGG